MRRINISLKKKNGYFGSNTKHQRILLNFSIFNSFIFYFYFFHLSVFNSVVIKKSPFEKASNLSILWNVLAKTWIYLIIYANRSGVCKGKYLEMLMSCDYLGTEKYIVKAKSGLAKLNTFFVYHSVVVLKPDENKNHFFSIPTPLKSQTV